MAARIHAKLLAEHDEICKTSSKNTHVSCRLLAKHKEIINCPHVYCENLIVAHFFMRRVDCVSPTCHCSNSGTQVGRCAAMEEAVEQLANLRRQIHNVQSRRSSCKRKSCESLLAEFSCPKRLQHRVLLVYIYSGHCSQVAAEFLKRSLAAFSNSHGDSLDYEATVENLYIEAPLQVIVDLETADVLRASM